MISIRAEWLTDSAADAKLRQALAAGSLPRHMKGGRRGRILDGWVARPLLSCGRACNNNRGAQVDEP